VEEGHSRSSAEPARVRAGPLKRWGPLVVLGALMAIAYASGIHRQLSFENLVLRRDELHVFTDNHALTAALLYMTIYWIVVALSLPGAGIITIVGGLLFGAWWATPVTVTAATLGATTVFLIARSSLGAALSERAGPWLARFREGFEREGLNYMLFLRLVPFPFFVINLVPAVLGVPLKTFVVGTFLGIIPATFAFSYLGDTLDRIVVEAHMSYDACVAAKGQASCHLTVGLDALPVKQILIALTLLGLLALVPPLVKKWRARHATV
jgi:uncharacterized membrane protein YdjX (TVP38/TMEM64 family)